MSLQTRPRSRTALALGVILTAQLMLQMDFLIVTVALPQIQADLGFSAAGLSWVPNAFALAFGGLLLLGGRLGDLLGRVRAFQMGIALFVGASLLGGLAQSQALLVAARVLQGAGSALAAPSVLALIAGLARDEAERNRGMSLFIAVSSIGASAGLVLGGALTELASWRWSLLINVPIGLVVVAVIGRLVAETPRAKARLDVVGALTATLASTALVHAFVAAAGDDVSPGMVNRRLGQSSREAPIVHRQVGRPSASLAGRTELWVVPFWPREFPCLHIKPRRPSRQTMPLAVPHCFPWIVWTGRCST
jgi:MFS family permease